MARSMLDSLRGPSQSPTTAKSTIRGRRPLPRLETSGGNVMTKRRASVAAAIAGLVALALPIGWVWADHVRIEVTPQPQPPSTTVIVPSPQPPPRSAGLPRPPSGSGFHVRVPSRRRLRQPSARARVVASADRGRSGCGTVGSTASSGSRCHRGLRPAFFRDHAVDLRYDRFTWATGGPWAGRLTVIARRDGARSEWMELLRQRQAITVYGPVRLRSAQPCDNDPIDADKSRSAKVRAGHGAREASLGARLGGRDVGPALDELPPRGAHGRGGARRPGRGLCGSGGRPAPPRRPRPGGEGRRRPPAPPRGPPGPGR